MKDTAIRTEINTRNFLFQYHICRTESFPFAQNQYFNYSQGVLCKIITHIKNNVKILFAIHMMEYHKVGVPLLYI